MHTNSELLQNAAKSLKSVEIIKLFKIKLDFTKSFKSNQNDAKLVKSTKMILDHLN